MAYEATKISWSFMPIKIGEPLVVVHILWGYFLSIITMPHWGFSDASLIIFSVLLIASSIDFP